MDFGTANWIPTQAVANASGSGDLLIAAREGRRSVLIRNPHVSAGLYVGPDDTVSSSTGFLIPAEESLRIYTQGAVYGVTTTGSITVHVVEEF